MGRNQHLDKPATIAQLDVSGSVQVRVVSGVKWSAVSKMGSQILQFAVGLVLARILAPEQFGLIASVYVISGFTVIFFEFGLTAALVQMKDPTQRDLSTAFWLNVGSGLVFTALLTSLAPLVANFYGQPVLRSITPLVALSFLFALGVVHRALMERLLLFKRIAITDLAAALVGNTVSIVGALLGFGVYALAVGALASSVSASVFSMIALPWRPNLAFSRTSVHRFWRFSGGMLGFNVVNYWGRNADNLLIGKFFGASPLGLYNRAYNLMLLPIYQINGALGQVMFPALSAMQGENDRIRRAYIRSVSVVNAVTLPVMAGMAAVSPGLAPLLWGPQWSSVSAPLAVLCVAGMPQCVLNSLGWIFQSQGRTGLQFRLSVVWSLFGVGLIVLGLNWGVVGVAIAVAIRYWMEFPVTVYFAGRLVGFRVRDVLKPLSPSFGLSVLMGAIVFLLPLFLRIDTDQWSVFIPQIAIGIVIYVIGLRWTQKALWQDVWTTVRRRQ